MQTIVLFIFFSLLKLRQDLMKSEFLIMYLKIFDKIQLVFRCLRLLISFLHKWNEIIILRSSKVTWIDKTLSYQFVLCNLKGHDKKNLIVKEIHRIWSLYLDWLKKSQLWLF